jgi:hypothetical protein
MEGVADVDDFKSETLYQCSLLGFFFLHGSKSGHRDGHTELALKVCQQDLRVVVHVRRVRPLAWLGKSGWPAIEQQAGQLVVLLQRGGHAGIATRCADAADQIPGCRARHAVKIPGKKKNEKEKKTKLKPYNKLQC